MSDLNDFIMCEDSKIREQEQRFKDEWVDPGNEMTEAVPDDIPAEGDFTGL